MASTSQLDDDDGDPRHSSAALCISLNLLGETFSPEYTHQCFDGEWIRGYQPFLMGNAEPHKSHLQHQVATHELQAIVTLAPSCELSHVELSIRKKVRESVSRRPRKRQRLSVIHESGCSSSNTESEEEPEDSSDDNYTEGSKDDTEDDHSDAGSTRHRRMHPDEIVERLGRALPQVSTESVRDDYLRKPVGKQIKTYTKTIGSTDQEFILTLADGDQASDYHSQVQNLALFFIESADGVNLSANSGGGYWKALYLFRKHGTRKYALCGYMTLFHFNAPFKKPKPGIIMRICQALLLPPYQRMGHGKVMMRAVHTIAAASADIVEINVEDPAPGFISLRNRVDFELLAESLTTKEPWLPSKYTKEGDFPVLSETDLSTASSRGRITSRQVQIAYELYKLQSIDKLLHEKNFRLMVKKRLLKANREYLGACKTKEERQRQLDVIFQELYADYKTILKKN